MVDFGASEFLSGSEVLPNVYGTIRYSSPEMANHFAGPKTDVYSAGVVMYILMTGQLPFPVKTEDALLKRLKRYPHPEFKGSKWRSVSQVGTSTYCITLVQQQLHCVPGGCLLITSPKAAALNPRVRCCC